MLVTNLSNRHLAPGRQVTAELAAVLPSHTLMFVVRVEDWPPPTWQAPDWLL